MKYLYLQHRLIAVMVLLAVCMSWITPCAAQTRPKAILILHSYHKADWTDSLLRGIQQVLGQTGGVDFSIEYMDTKRIKTEAYYAALENIFRLKYGAFRFDALITTDDNAYQFAMARQSTLFKGAPIVFCGVNNFDPRELEKHPRVTGVVEKGDFQDTLQFAARACPDATAVYVIVDHTMTAQINLEGFVEVIKRRHSALTVHLLRNLSMADLGARLAAIPANDFAFFISYWLDNANEPVSPDNLGKAFDRSAVPIFGRSEWMMGKGMTGGKCVSGFYQGKAAARLARRILKGEPASDIPVILDSPNQFMFDYERLKRYGIDPAMIPAASLLFHKPVPSYYESHRILIWSVITVLVVLAILVVVLGTNIAIRRKAENALRESEARYRQLVQHAPAGICEIDLQRRRFLSANDVICTYTGYTHAEFMALDPTALVVEEDLSRVQQSIADARPDQPTPPAMEFRIKSKNGQVFWILVNTRFIFKEGVPAAAFAVIHDLTASRQAEAAKKELEAKLMQVRKMESLGTLAGGIAHDFNNLLTGVLGNVSLMQMDEGRNWEDLERLRNVETYVRRGVGLTSQLLGLARGGKYEVKPANPNLLVGQCVTLFGSTKKEIRIHQKLQEGLWNIECDQNQIDQVLLNILINAWQAMPDGGDLFVSTQNAVLDQQVVQPHGVPAGRYVQISITDTGIGMDPAIMAKIFDPFFTTKERQRGTGLGLASSYGIVKNHGGLIDVSSRPGHGSTFHIYLPAVDKAVVDELSENDDALRGCERILMVDDEAMVIDVGRKMLEKLGYEVLTATSGEKALEIYQTHKGAIDVVVLDMIMPDMSGTETFLRLQQIDAEVRVLLSSGYSINGQATEILRLGGRGFIQKPFRAHDLSQKIRNILDPS